MATKKTTSKKKTTKRNGAKPAPAPGEQAIAAFEAGKGDSDNAAKLFYQLPAARRLEVTGGKLRKRLAHMATTVEGWDKHPELRQAGTAMVEAFDGFMRAVGTVPNDYEPPKAVASSGKLEAGATVFIREKFQEKFAAFGIEPGAALEVTRTANGQVLCKAPNGATPIISRAALQTTPVQPKAEEGAQA